MRKAYLDRRRPCWECNHSLMRVVTGEHKGKYVAVVISGDDGHEHYLHETCYDRTEVGGRESKMTARIAGVAALYSHEEGFWGMK